MKNLFKYLLFFVVLFSSTEAFSQLYPGGPIDPRDAIDQGGNIISNLDPNNPLPDLEVHNTTYFKLCEIRRFFCGATKVVLIASAIFIIGLLVIVGKITWMRVIIILTGISIFSTAEYVTMQLTTMPPNLGVIYSCYCIDSVLNKVEGLFD